MRDIQDLLAEDLNQDFLDLLRTEFAGVYTQSYWDRAAPPGKFLSRDDATWQENQLDGFRTNRRHLGNDALLRASKFAEVPAELRLLPCNGMRFAVARLNRILIMQEPSSNLTSGPVDADYKRHLAASAIAMRQLEFDFGYGFRSRIDSANTLLVVIRHGWAGTSFTQAGTALSALELAVPNANYESWLWTGNVLSGSISTRLGWREVASKQNGQSDAVKIHWRETGEKRL